MPSTRRQKARKSREMDILYEHGNMDVMLGDGNTISMEWDHDNVKGRPDGQRDF